MQRFEYNVVPAPRKGEKIRGVKATEDRFALALAGLMNQMGADGWEYLRADSLPCDERVGLTGSKTTFQNMLIFRRSLGTGAETLQEARPDAPVLRAALPESTVPLRLGAPTAPEGAAPAVGPAKPGLAAE